MAPPTYTVLITGMGASTAQSVAKAFRSQSELSVRLVGVDTFPPHLSSASHFCDTLHLVPPVSQRDSYEQRLLQIVGLERADLIVPILDPELLYFAEARELFEAAGARLVMGSLATHRICGSKFETAKHLRAEGLPFAQTLPLSEASNLSFPLILKPDDGVSSSHVYRVNDEDELRVLGRRVPNPIVQSYISGNEFTIDVLCNKKSEPIAIVPRQRIDTKAGVATKAVTVFDEELISCARKISRSLRLIGPANLQCRRSDHEQPFFFEVNARFGSALPITVAAGVNMPLVLLKLALGHPPPSASMPFEAGVYLARFWDELFFRV